MGDCVDQLHAYRIFISTYHSYLEGSSEYSSGLCKTSQSRMACRKLHHRHTGSREAYILVRTTLVFLKLEGPADKEKVSTRVHTHARTHTHTHTRYGHIWNKVTSKLQQAKRQYFSIINPSNPKQFWKSVKALDKQGTSVNTLLHNGPHALQMNKKQML